MSFPELPVEQLPIELADRTPDILHISSHGDGGRLMLADDSHKKIEIDASTLMAYLNYRKSPRIVYINACNSHAIAEVLSESIPFVIGTTAPITNKAALASAQIFYHRLLSGHTVSESHSASKAVIDALHSKECSSRLFSKTGFNADVERIHETPRVIAKFSNDRGEIADEGYFDVHVGISGCPADTCQIVIYTDDETFIEDDCEDENEVASCLCQVVRGAPTGGRVWSKDVLTVYGDYRIFISGVTGGGRMFSASGTLCGALEEYPVPDAKRRVAMARAISALRLHADSYDPF
jgi:hypothetical protein